MEHDEPPRPRRSRSRLMRVLLGLLAGIVVVWVLFTVVFPWFQEYQDDPTLEGAGVPTVAVAVAPLDLG